MREKLYWTIERFSLRYAYFLFLTQRCTLLTSCSPDTKVRVWFESEYTKEGSPYRAILCRVRKRDVPEFLAALEELKRRCCSAGISTMFEVSAFMDAVERERRRQIKMKLTPLKKQSKNAQRKYYALSAAHGMGFPRLRALSKAEKSMTETASGRRNDAPLKIDRKQFRIREKIITIILRPKRLG